MNLLQRACLCVSALALASGCSIPEQPDPPPVTPIAAKAQYELGLMHAKGQGVPQDYTEAMRRFRLAADQGYDKAQKKIDRGAN